MARQKRLCGSPRSEIPDTLETSSLLGSKMVLQSSQNGAYRSYESNVPCLGDGVIMGCCSWRMLLLAD